MKNKCHCYHIQKKCRYTYNPITGSPIPHDTEVGVCWGTKEIDECNCGGLVCRVRTCKKRLS